MSDRPPGLRPMPWGLGATVGAFLVGIVGSGLGASLAVAFGAATKSIAVTAGGLLGEWVGFVGVPVALSLRRGSGSVADDFGFRLAGWREAAAGAAAGAATYVVVLDLLYPPFLYLLEQIVGHHVEVGNAAKQLGAEGRGIGFVVFALCVTVGAPIAEELFFRGLLMRSLQRVIGPGWGIVASAVLFGLVHAGSTEAAALPALVIFGLVLGLLYERSGRLGPGIAAHMAFNGITVIALAASR